MIMKPRTAVVVGGGIAGCSTAHALAVRGIQVKLFERHETIASEASGNPQAMLYPRLSGDDVASQFALESYLYSLDFFNRLDLNSADFNQCGMLQLGFNPRELERINKVSSQFYSSNILRYVTAVEASVLAGIDINNDALYFPNAAWINPQRLCQRLIEHDNISLKTLTKIDKILINKDLFEIFSNEILLSTSDIVVIANANDAQSLGVNLYTKTHAVRGQVSIIDATEDSKKLKLIICSDGYLSPSVNQQHCLGATFSSECLNSEINEDDHLANLARLNSISNHIYENLKSNVKGGRVSFRCTSSDYFPLVGELLDSYLLKSNPPRPNARTADLPWIKGMYLNLAHGSRGFTSAPFCGELLAQIICSEPYSMNPEIASLLNPNRFLLRKIGLKRLAKMTLNSKTINIS